MFWEVITSCRGSCATEAQVTSGELGAVAFRGLGTACVSPNTCPLVRTVQAGAARRLSPPTGPPLTPSAVEPSWWVWYLPWARQ